MNLHFVVLAKIGFRVKKVLASTRLARMHNFIFIPQYTDQMKEDGWTENRDGHQFIFKEDCVSLKIPENPPYDIVDGWKIIPQTTPLEVYYYSTIQTIIIIMIKHNNRLTKLQLMDTN